MHPYRDKFVETMTYPEQDAFARHMRWLQKLDAESRLILAGLSPCVTQIAEYVSSKQLMKSQAREIAARETVTSFGIMVPQHQHLAIPLAKLTVLGYTVS
jgi:hypothetical protein